MSYLIRGLLRASSHASSHTSCTITTPSFVSGVSSAFNMSRVLASANSGVAAFLLLCLLLAPSQCAAQKNCSTVVTSVTLDTGVTDYALTNLSCDANSYVSGVQGTVDESGSPIGKLLFRVVSSKNVTVWLESLGPTRGSSTLCGSVGGLPRQVGLTYTPFLACQAKNATGPSGVCNVQYNFSAVCVPYALSLGGYSDDNAAVAVSGGVSAWSVLMLLLVVAMMGC